MGRATLIGFSAVAMWALLALLTDASGAVPPFLLSAITFTIGTAVGLVARLFMPAADKGQKIPRQVWLAFDARYTFGYAMAGVCAVLWSSYSLLSWRFPSVPTSIVTWFCAATAALSFVCHLLLEKTVLPDGAGQWLTVLGLGLLPVGAAFYAWDIGVKRGNIQVLGAASYAAPLLSTLVLIAAGVAEPSLRILAACVLITGGAALAAKSLFLRKPATIGAQA